MIPIKKSSDKLSVSLIQITDKLIKNNNDMVLFYR